MAEADAVLVRLARRGRRARACPRRPRPRDRRVATLLGGAALVGATATMAVAAPTSLPSELAPRRQARRRVRAGAPRER